MCKNCQLKPVYEFTNKRKLCKKCFIKYFQKKVLYIIRKFKMIKKNDVVGYEDKNDFRSVVLEDVLKMFAKKWMIEIVKLCSQTCDISKQLINRKKILKIAIGQTVDLTAYRIINTLINKNVKNLKDVAPIEKLDNKIIIKPLYLFLDKEVLLYAKLKELKFKKEKQVKNKINFFIDELEKKHPEVKRAVVNSYLKLYY